MLLHRFAGERFGSWADGDPLLVLLDAEPSGGLLMQYADALFIAERAAEASRAAAMAASRKTSREIGEQQVTSHPESTSVRPTDRHPSVGPAGDEG